MYTSSLLIASDHGLEAPTHETISQISNTHAEVFEWTEAQETAVRSKIDLHIVPLTTFLYLLCVSLQ